MDICGKIRARACERGSALDLRFSEGDPTIGEGIIEVGVKLFELQEDLAQVTERIRGCAPIEDNGLVGL